MYEKMNESRDSEKETKIKHVNRKVNRKRNYQKPEKKNQTKSEKMIVSDAAHQFRTNNTTVGQKQTNA